MREVKPTQKPVPSSDIKDLFFNSGLLDIWATSLEHKYIDRFGNCHLTAAGMEWIFNELVTKFKIESEQALLAAGYAPAGTFQEGAEVVSRNGTVLWKLPDGDGDHYRWDGDLPKQVPAGSTPQSIGGIGKGAWVSVGDASLRNSLGKIVKTYLSVTEMLLDVKSRAIAEGEVFRWQGYYSQSDGGSGWGVVKKGAHTEDGGSIFSIDYNTYIEANHGSSIYTKKFGLRGDGSIETVQLKRLFSFVRNTGKKITAKEGEVYNCDDYLMLENAHIDFGRATLKFSIVGNSSNLQTKFIANVKNITLEQAGTPVGELGFAGQRLLFALSPKNCEHKNITFKCGGFGHAPHNLLGNCDNVDISNITFEDGPWAMGTIIHWATLNDESAENYLTDINYSTASESNPTIHPKNINISNLKYGDMTGGGNLASLLFISGCYNINAVNIFGRTANRCFTVIAGDYANEFAVDEEKSLIGTGIRISSPTLRNARKRGIAIDGSGILTANKLDMDVTIENPNVTTIKSEAGAEYGAFIEHSKRVRVSGGKISSFPVNLLLRNGVKGFDLDGTEISRADRAGFISTVTDTELHGKNSNINIRNAWVHNNNLSNVQLPDNSGIRFSETIDSMISFCKFGDPLSPAEYQHHSVYIKDTCDNVKVTGTHTYKAGSDSAISAELVTQYKNNLYESGNTSETLFTTNPVGHVFYETKPPENRKFIANLANPPLTGTWKKGDEVIFRDPVAAGNFIGAVCVASGTPGTWKKYGGLA